MHPLASTPPDMEPFTLVEESRPSKPFHLFDKVRHLSDAHTADHDLQYVHKLRATFPEMIVTAIPAYNINLRAFAAAGFAAYQVDTETDSFTSWRGYTGPSPANRRGSLAESVTFAKCIYQWAGETFIVYIVGNGVQYVLKERRDGEDPLGPSKVTDALIAAAGQYALQDVVWVFDGYWRADKNLFREVEKASWDKVILDESMKEELVAVSEKFFSSKDIYDDLGVPWKRGLLFHGPPGNGKTVSIKALMHTLFKRKFSIPTLYVKSAPNTYTIGLVFAQARQLAPCMLVLEDIETIVTPQTRSYFFNQMDGLENNNGLFVVASTNFLERLDPGLTKRPSRFDRKYLFPLPNEHERTLYCDYWRKKLGKKSDIAFPEKLCPAMAHITPGFSFAFLQECFVATLLVLATGEAAVPDDDDADLNKYAIWNVFKEQAEILRRQIESQGMRSGHDLHHIAGHASFRQQDQTVAFDCCRVANAAREHMEQLEKLRLAAQIPHALGQMSLQEAAGPASGAAASGLHPDLPPDGHIEAQSSFMPLRGAAGHMSDKMYSNFRRNIHLSSLLSPSAPDFSRDNDRANEYTPDLGIGKGTRINSAAFMLE